MNWQTPSTGKPIRIRMENPESASERLAIRAVIVAAFGGCEEADLVDQLRGSYALASVVAESGSGIVGHALLGRMWIRTLSTLMSAVALAPVAVVPGYQRKGIGGRLIAAGLAEMKRQQERIVIVVGHSSYYPRFGFSSSRTASLDSPFPHDSFMALELVEGALDGVHGRVVYPPPFGL